MIYVLAAAVFLLLGVGGMLAFNNNQLVKNRNETGYIPPAASTLMYSVEQHSVGGLTGNPDTTPLFWLQPCSSNSDRTAGVEQKPAITLYRVAAGKGEMILSDAYSFLLNYIRLSAARGDVIQHKAFIDKSFGESELELVLNLERLLKEGTYRENQD